MCIVNSTVQALVFLFFCFGGGLFAISDLRQATLAGASGLFLEQIKELNLYSQIVTK